MRWLCHVKIDDQPRLNGKLQGTAVAWVAGIIAALVGSSGREVVA